MIALRASRIFPLACIGMHFGAGLALVALPVSSAVQLALGILILVSAVLTIRPQLHAGSGVGLIQPSLIQVRFASATGGPVTRASELGTGSVILPGMVKLGLREPLATAGTDSLVIWYDQMDRDDFRRLRRELACWMRRSRNSGAARQSESA